MLQPPLGAANSQRRLARPAHGTYKRLFRDTSLAVGATVAGVGILTGLAAPETDKEDQFLGGTRDAIMDRAAQEALNAAKQEAQEQDLLPGSQG
jgi:hypothetical protein